MRVQSLDNIDNKFLHLVWMMQNTVTTVNLQGREHWGKMRKEYNKMWPIKTDVRKMHWGWKKKSENESDICICWDVKRNLTIFNNYFWHFFFFFLVFLFRNAYFTFHILPPCPARFLDKVDPWFSGGRLNVSWVPYHIQRT